MTKIFINYVNKSKVTQEIAYANNLLKLSNFQENFFKKISKQSEKLTDRYIEFFNKHNCIAVPAFLDKKLSFSEKHFLKNPENILKYPNQFEDVVFLIQVKEANLVTLDELSCYFEKGYKLPDRIYVLNSDDRLSQYSDVILGIGSPRITYKDTKILQSYRNILKIELEKLVKSGRTDLKKYSIYFTLGTTAISPKGIKV